jgi:integrase
MGIWRDQTDRKPANHQIAELGHWKAKTIEGISDNASPWLILKNGRNPWINVVTEFGRPVNVNSLVHKHFKPILKRAGLPNIRLYDLRQTAATLVLTVGVSPKVVSEQLGHTSAAFTLDVYSHVLPHRQDDAAAKVEAVRWEVHQGIKWGPSTISDKHRDRAPQSTAQPARRRCHICEGES